MHSRSVSGLLHCLLVVLFYSFADGRPFQDRILGESDWPSQILPSLGFLAQTGTSTLSDQSVENISGYYRGTWEPRDGNVSGTSQYVAPKEFTIFLRSTLSRRPELHIVRGFVTFKGLFGSEDTPMRLDGVYVATRKYHGLRAILHSYTGDDVEGIGPAGYRLPLDGGLETDGRNSAEGSTEEAAEDCKIHMELQVHIDIPFQAKALHGRVYTKKSEDSQECFKPLFLNATSDNQGLYNKAVNYTLLVTFISFLQVLFLIRQMEHSNSQSGAAKVSLWMIGQQAIMDAYLCLGHLTAGIVVENLFNAFATAAFFKFVIFSIFEMRYLLAIWRARRPGTFGEGWETVRREISILYSRFYGFLLGGILLMYQFSWLLWYILLLFYSFWIPQIVSNAVRDSRKPLHPHYILGISITRLAIPLFMLIQAALLLLQHYFGSRCFIPRQCLPERYSYFRSVDRSTIQGVGAEDGCGIDCVICMAPVEMSQRRSQRERMVTPCDHVFHANCLQRWMDVKMECPTCRRPLPPI
ncbi:hypothetical protein CBR_g36920 [Chara braunii]|uniref:RING-type E3 ubiquitin transferase n=1 Tax=Chara braunii TaxID=69332 RepID=A0A388JZA8_CHABU|nr:hypothetical protein CBR_g36920 [Chara braunii]|eukprot:GBG63151.1 hypothetical protein CBR_g36920 [Chara braunii]